MGGKLFNSKRLNRKEFFEIQLEIRNWLVRQLSSDHIMMLSQLADKESFGDLDLIVSNTLTESCMKLLERSGMPYKKNGEVLSFLYEDFQVDLILVKEELLSYSSYYFSDGDKSNLIGKLIKHLYGVTFSSKGPYFKLNINNGEYVTKIFLEESPYLDYSIIVFKLLGLPPKYSFTQKKLFDWISSSPFFVKYIYNLDYMNSEQRSRDKRRPFYQDWLKYLETLDKPSYDTRDETLFFMSYLHHLYPNLAKELEKHHKNWKEIQDKKKVFSGSLIKNLIGLEGKALGDFIRYLKQNHYEEVLLGFNANDDLLYLDLINNLYDKYKGSNNA